MILSCLGDRVLLKIDCYYLLIIQFNICIIVTKFATFLHENAEAIASRFEY